MGFSVRRAFGGISRNVRSLTRGVERAGGEILGGVGDVVGDTLGAITGATAMAGAMDSMSKKQAEEAKLQREQAERMQNEQIAQADKLKEASIEEAKRKASATADEEKDLSAINEGKNRNTISDLAGLDTIKTSEKYGSVLGLDEEEKKNLGA